MNLKALGKLLMGAGMVLLICGILMDTSVDGRVVNIGLANDRLILVLIGARKRELLDAKWEDFDVERRNWRIPMSKSGKARHVPLSTAVLDILKSLPRWDGCPYVVPNPQTLRPFKSVFYSWNTARKEAGLDDVRMHDLRHSMASNLVNSGRSIYEVSKILGHSQIKTSQRYAHLAHETLLAAADAASSSWM